MLAKVVIDEATIKGDSTATINFENAEQLRAASDQLAPAD